MRRPGADVVAVTATVLLVVGVLAVREDRTNGIPAVREVHPVVPDAALTAPACRHGDVVEGRAPAGFAPADVWRCVEGRTEVTGWTPEVQAVLDGPDETLWYGDAPCAAIPRIPVDLWVVDADGRGYRPRVPGDYCSPDSYEATRFFETLPWHSA